MKKVLKKMVGLLMATIMIGSMLVGSVSAAAEEYQMDGAIVDGYFHELEYRSAPYFDLQIDGITLINTAFK